MAGSLRKFPTTHLLPYAAPAEQYRIYARQEHSHSWLETLNHWKSVTKARVDWKEHFDRAPDNRAIHTMTPVVWCTLHEVPSEDVQVHLRRASYDPRIAAMEAESAVRAWLEKQCQKNAGAPGRKTLKSFHCTIEDNGPGAHNRYTAKYINYVCALEGWVVTDCTSVGDTKALAQQAAAQQMIQSNRYCMLAMKRR